MTKRFTGGRTAQSGRPALTADALRPCRGSWPARTLPRGRTKAMNKRTVGPGKERVEFNEAGRR